ncbi:hypothetical protein BDBG_18069 [Blastomyces gilchristii SLH14081]|uniref:Uncharacterized protein n=1 Tax=Blastomyces gilchristii (strain SLH14081) TaxID=559298 RepID=A0A179V4Z3_BLAGS|nr:uncharacterized protein BDBG_18069 [Blastomyces gilchristii SLH14081]OAT14519.1 hypothetical protein BDBG_18069 [Blastomyces gilchristii SLH14081]
MLALREFPASFASPISPNPTLICIVSMMPPPSTSLYIAREIPGTQIIALHILAARASLPSFFPCISASGFSPSALTVYAKHPLFPHLQEWYMCTIRIKCKSLYFENVP